MQLLVETSTRMMRVFKQFRFLLFGLLFLSNTAAFAGSLLVNEKQKIDNYNPSPSLKVNPSHSSNHNYSESNNSDIEVEEEEETEDNEGKQLFFNQNHLLKFATEDDFSSSSANKYKATHGSFSFIPLYQLFHCWKSDLIKK